MNTSGISAALAKLLGELVDGGCEILDPAREDRHCLGITRRALGQLVDRGSQAFVDERSGFELRDSLGQRLEQGRFELGTLGERRQLLLERTHPRRHLDVAGRSLGQFPHRRLQAFVHQRSGGKLLDLPGG